MGILIALLGVLLILCVCDVRMRLAYYLDRRHRFAVMSRMQNWGLRVIVAVVKAYGGFRVRLQNRLQATLPERFLILSNHQSLVDIAVLAYAFPRHNVRFVAKKELGRGVPGISFMLSHGRHALIDRRGGFRETRAELIRLLYPGCRLGADLRHDRPGGGLPDHAPRPASVQRGDAGRQARPGARALL